MKKQILNLGKALVKQSKNSFLEVLLEMKGGVHTQVNVQGILYVQIL